VNHPAKEHRRHERLREYDAELATASSVLAVLALFVRARETRAHGASLEEAFAEAGVDGAAPLPAAVWVALRQNDVEATLDLLVSLSTTDFLIAEHEQVDDTYRLVSVEENRRLPELDRLIAQLSQILHVPEDVVAMIAGWGADDPRTAAEIEGLLEQRFGARAAGTTTLPEPARAPGGLTMSDGEFGALLNLSPEQRQVLATLVRQATVTVQAAEQR
jgi:hypothetical protein